MKRTLPAIAVVLLLSAPSAWGDPINAVLGDASWAAKYGEEPTESATETARIQVHLNFVLDLLSQSDVGHLSPAQRERRKSALAALRGYIDRSEFPIRDGDDYLGRRPRFIDSRGVHCAVGFLIAESGWPELAMAINATYEFGYVSEMRSVALTRWATDTGLSTFELAMIQPSYSAVPTEEGTRRAIAARKDSIAMRCAVDHPPVAKVRLEVRGNRSGNATAKATTPGPFARCFAEQASAIENGGGAYMGSPRPYKFAQVLTLKSPQAQLDESLARVPFDYNRCRPRPGPVVRRVSLSVSSDGSELRVAVTSKSVNPEVLTCLENLLRPRFREFTRGKWRVSSQAVLAFGPAVTNRVVREIVRNNADSIARVCYGETSPAAKGQFFVVARKNAAGFDVSVEAGDRVFEACAQKRMARELKKAFTVDREVDGEKRRYFRIDGNARVTHRLKLLTPKQRAKRRERLRRRLEKERERHGLY